MTPPCDFYLGNEYVGYVLAHSFELLATVEQADEALLPDELVAQAQSFRAFLSEVLESK